MKKTKGEILIDSLIQAAQNLGVASERHVEIPGGYQKDLEKAKQNTIAYVKELEERCGEIQ